MTNCPFSAITRKIFLLAVLTLFAVGFQACRRPTAGNEVIQLNWFHDPTFAGEYELASQRDIGVVVREGGPAVQPLAEVISERATYAVVGIDIFIAFLDKAAERHEDPNLVCIFADFQRNPVGWVLHPDAATELGLRGRPSQKELNDWLASQLVAGKVRMGDKRGTETTSIWVQWKKVRGLPESVHVEPVGFDPKVILQSPRLAYPVYLNEEPYKLQALIGKDVAIFDPAADGVLLYGNVVVCRKDFAASHRDRVGTIQKSLRAAWHAVRSNPQSSVRQVSTLYKGVSDVILEEQIRKTTDFVFDGTQEPGTIDVSPEGRLAITLSALRNGGLVSTNLNFSTLLTYVVPPE
jgi:hypothetical protein